MHISLWHVYPTNDLKDHDIGNTTDCWCHPRVEECAANNGYIAIHNSMDGREDYETGKRNPH